MKTVLVFLFLFSSHSGVFSQNSIGAGTRLKISDFDYFYGGLENKTNILYTNPSFELIGTNSFIQNNNSSKFQFGYTFEVGFSFYKFTKINSFLPIDPYWKIDTVGIETKENFKGKKVQFSNFVDFHIKINNKLTFITSLGFKLENRGGYKRIDNTGFSAFITVEDNYKDEHIEKRESISAENFQNRFPLNFKLILAPQLQIKFNEFYLKIQLFQDLLNINKYINAIDVGGINYRTFSGLGIIISPNSVLKKRTHYINKQ